MEVKTERILTVVVVAIVIALMAAMVAVVVMTNDGSLDEEASTVSLVFLSTTLSTVVIVFGVLVLSTSRKDEYRKYFEEREKEKLEGKKE